MDFKKFKREVKKENISIPQMSEEVKLYSKEKNQFQEKRYFKNRNFNFKLSFSLITVLVIMFAIIIIGSPNKPSYEKSYQLESIQSLKDLKQVISYSINNDGLYDDPEAMPPTAEPESPGEGSDSGQNDYQDTNEQEEGVKEADIVKTDGTRIYYINYQRNKLYSYNVVNKELKMHSFIFYREMAHVNFEMYLNDDYIILTYSGYNKMYNNIIGIVVLDKITFEEVKRYEGNGYYSDSRVVDNVLYFVYSNRIFLNEDPSLVEYIDNKEYNVNYSEINYSREIVNNSITYLVAMDLDTLEIDRNYMLGNGWDTIYATKDSLYLCTTMSFYDVNKNTINGISPEENDFLYKTVIFRYEYDVLKINYKGHLSTYGSVINQFCLDEHAGYLRVAVNVGNNSFGQNRLEIYALHQVNADNKIEKVASINDGIGKVNESIKSVRFKDDSCLIVTYEQKDPLYYINLENQLNPYIVAGYEEPGYNLYLHYMNDKLAFGIGLTDFWNVKVGLYELVDGIPNKLWEDANTIQSTPALYNHKALFVDKDVFGFSYMDIYQYNSYYRLYKVSENEYGYGLTIALDVKGNWERMIRINDQYYLIGSDGIWTYDSNYIKIANIEY